MVFARKYLFYKPEHNAKEGSHGIKFWRYWNAEINIPTERAQRTHDKNRVICLVIVFAPRAMVIKIWNLAPFIGFSTDKSKKLVTV